MGTIDKEVLWKDGSELSSMRSGVRAGLERTAGGFLAVTSGLGIFVWLMFVANALLGGEGGTITVRGTEVLGPLAALIIAPLTLAMVVTQGLLGIGMLKEREWVGWFGVLYALGGLLAAGTAAFMPAGSWFAVVPGALLATLPTWILAARWRRGDMKADQGMNEGREG